MAICVSCSKPLRGDGLIFCNAACKQKAYRRGFTPYKRACKCGCGFMMWIETWQSEKRLKWASDACRKRASRRNGEEFTPYKRKCLICPAMIEIKDGRSEKRSEYCSAKCKQKAYRMRKRDERLGRKTRQEMREFFKTKP